MNKSGHEELAVEAVHDPPVAGDGVSEVLDLKGALEAAGEEATEGSDDRGEERHGDRVQHERVHAHCLHLRQPHLVEDNKEKIDFCLFVCGVILMSGQLFRALSRVPQGYALLHWFYATEAMNETMR